MGLDLVQRLEQLRAEERQLRWRGTFAEYFDLVRADPGLARLAHARVHDMIVGAGIETDTQGRTRYGFFADEIYGIDGALDQLVEYFRSAAQRLEVRKRILLLMGPVGGGKSTIVSLLKRGLERHTRTDAGSLPAFSAPDRMRSTHSASAWSVKNVCSTTWSNARPPSESVCGPNAVIPSGMSSSPCAMAAPRRRGIEC